MCDWFLLSLGIVVLTVTHCVAYFVGSKNGWNAGFDEAIKYRR